MIKPRQEYTTYIANLFDKRCGKRSIRNITFQVCDSCNLCCSYCYQYNKGTHSMSFNTAKKFIDYIFENKYNPDSSFYIEKVAGLIIDFIGGEPFLEIDLIEQITEYCEQKFAEHPEDDWALFHTYNFSSNGTLYFTDKIQKYLKKYNDLIHINITVDGCKELHDKCRCYPNGKGSYDQAISAALDQLHHYGNNGTKITISPDNVSYLFEGFKNMINLGFNQIHANCVFENVWTNIKDVKEYYNQLKMIADWIKENNLQDKIYFIIFNTSTYTPSDRTNLKTNWCGTTDNMFALDYKGDIYTCIRFMESSLSKEPIIIGSNSHGIGQTDKEKKYLKELAECTREAIFDEECLNCPINSGCSYCLGCSYDQTGDFKTHTKTTCQTMKVQWLATLYFYKILNDKESYKQIYKLPYNSVKNIITEEEYNNLIRWEE